MSYQTGSKHPNSIFLEYFSFKVNKIFNIPIQLFSLYFHLFIYLFLISFDKVCGLRTTLNSTHTNPWNLDLDFFFFLKNPINECCKDIH